MSNQALPRPSRWLISPVADLTFFLALPALALVAIAGLSLLWTPIQIMLVAYGVLSLGHHLPGFVKAYGDKTVFQRNRWTMLLAPPLVFAAMMALIHADLLGAVVALKVAWAAWHAMMQRFGIMRAYDGRIGATARGNVVMDRVLATLFGLACCFFWLQEQAYGFFTETSRSGLPLPSPAFYAAAGSVITTAFLVFWVVYLAYHAYLAATKRAFNPLKLVHAAAFMLAFYAVGHHWMTWVAGILVSEVCHDFEYFAMAYASGRQAARKGQGTRFLARLFTGGKSGVLVYGAIIAVYGAVSLIDDQLTAAAYPNVTNLITAFILTSSLLHYYYDGFIWRRAAPAPTGSRVARLLKGGPKVWQAAVATTALALFLVGQHAPADREELRRARDLAELLPGSAHARIDLAKGMAQRGQNGAAAYLFRQALEIDPVSIGAHLGLARVLYPAGGASMVEADGHLAVALALNPNEAAQIEGIRHKYAKRSPSLLSETVFALTPDL